MDHALVKRQKSYKVHGGDSVSKWGGGFPGWSGYILWVQIVLRNSQGSKHPKSLIIWAELNLAQKNCQFPQHMQKPQKTVKWGSKLKKFAYIQKILNIQKKI